MNSDRHDLQSDLEQTITDYVEVQREVVELMSGTESVAQAVHDAVDEAILAIRSPVDPRVSSALSRFRKLPHEYIEPALELFTARAFQLLLPDMVHLENRVESLVDLARDAAPSQRASTTLAKVARCYLMGLDAETIAMCRAALEVSVSDAIDILPDSGSKPAGMRHRLDLLTSMGRLSELQRDDALSVWQQGNEVLHNNIDNVQRAPELVAKTLRVASALFPQAPGGM